MSEMDILVVHSGKQSVWATGVTDTVRHMDITEFEIEPIADAKVLRPRLGNLANSRNAVLLKAGGKWKAKGFLTYQDINYWLEMLLGEATPSGGGPYVRAQNFAGTAVTPRVQSFYYGDSSGGVYRAVGAVASKLKISVPKNEEATYEVEGFCKSVATSSFASLSDRAVTAITGNDFALALDAWGGTIGATAVDATFYSFELEIDTKRDAKYYLGALAPGGYKNPAWTGSLKMHLEFNSTSKALFDAQLAASAVFQKQFRATATSGTNILRLDFAGTSEKMPKAFDEDDGVAVVDFNLMDTYNTTLGYWFGYSNTCGVSALP